MPDGGHFVGDFNANFRPHGEGTRFRADGSESASGEWRNGKLHGHRSKQTLLDGSRYEGDFVDGKHDGFGQFTWPDGSVHAGEFDDDKMDGLGMRWDARGRLTHCGMWKDGELTMSRPVPFGVVVDASLLSVKCESMAAQVVRVRRRL